MRKKVAEIGQNFLSALATATLIVAAVDFTSLAAEDKYLPNYVDAIESVEVLDAVLVEDINLPSGEVPYTMLSDCTIGVSASSEGMLIDISTGVVGTASVLGVKDIKIQKKTWYGGWTTVAISEGKEVSDRSIMGITILYSNAVKDATYRIKCIHYGDVNGYIEGENDSGEFVFTY